MDTSGLLSALREATSTLIGGNTSVAVAFSGGIDSSMIVSIAKEYSHVMCYTCAIEGSMDSRMASEYAAQEGVDHHEIRLSEKGLLELVVRASRVLGTTNPTRIAYTIPVLCILEECAETCVLAGNGADELFGGYAKYLDKEDPSEMMASDLKKMLGETKLLGDLASTMGRCLGFPFASKEIIAFAERTPLQDKIGGSGRKLILRETARTMGLPSHNRPKKAAQYSSGILKEMRRISRKEKLDLSDWISKIVRE